MNGPRSTPTYLRRVGGLAVDWSIAVVVSVLFFDYNGLWTLGIFNLLHMVGGLLVAGSPGHLVFRMRIAPIRGGALGILAPLLRPLLISLVIPAVIVDEDQRGAHDRLVGTILVRR
jgi:mannitol-specific phosphotransferase system IIBC component